MNSQNNSGQNINIKVEDYVYKDSLIGLRDSLLKKKLDLLNNAIDAYKSSLKNNSLDNDTRYNLAYAQLINKKTNDEINNNKGNNKNTGPSQYAQKVKSQADKLVNEFKFEDALKLLETAQKKDETVSKEYGDYINKIKTVVDINKLK